MDQNGKKAKNIGTNSVFTPKFKIIGFKIDNLPPLGPSQGQGGCTTDLMFNNTWKNGKLFG